MEELNACPCCGNEAILKEKADLWHGCMLKVWKIICTGCSCGAMNHSKEAVVEDWNRRERREGNDG